ncbi:hypothetical protein EU545_05045, partial [Candidatus Thorarchaeota archaeon]
MDDDSSFIGRNLKQTGNLLLGGAKKQVDDYKSKFESLKGTYDEFLSQILTSYSGHVLDPVFVDNFFEKRKLSFAGIDGTILKHDVFDLVIFFAGAYAAYGEVEVESDGNAKVSYEENYLEKGVGVSSVLPVYINEVPQIDQTLLVRAEDGSPDESVTFNDA